MPTFHPSYLLRFPKERHKTWEDMQQVMEYLAVHEEDLVLFSSGCGCSCPCAGWAGMLPWPRPGPSMFYRQWVPSTRAWRNSSSRAFAPAEKEKASALIIQLDTPGGLDTSMRAINQAIINAKVPVIVYVSPKGARAASAGMFITMAAHVAAMAPGTNIGAAHPVSVGMGKMDKVMGEKVVNDMVAYARSLALERGRNADWAEKAVRKSVSIDAQKAEKLKVVDLMAEDLDDLLKKVNGRTVKVGKEKVTLKTLGVPVKTISEGLRTQYPEAHRRPQYRLYSDDDRAGGSLLRAVQPRGGASRGGGGPEPALGLLRLPDSAGQFHRFAVNYLGLYLVYSGDLCHQLRPPVAAGVLPHCFWDR